MFKKLGTQRRNPRRTKSSVEVFVQTMIFGCYPGVNTLRSWWIDKWGWLWPELLKEPRYHIQSHPEGEPGCRDPPASQAQPGGNVLLSWLGLSPPTTLTIPSWLPALVQDWMSPRTCLVWMELWVGKGDISPHPPHRIGSVAGFDGSENIHLSEHPPQTWDTRSRMFPQSCIAWGAVPGFHSGFPWQFFTFLLFL